MISVDEGRRLGDGSRRLDAATALALQNSIEAYLNDVPIAFSSVDVEDQQAAVLV